jgi:hypothetical protein
MTEQPVFVAPKNRHLGLWFAGGLVASAIVVGVVFAESPPPEPTADASLEPGLLDLADFPASFRVETRTQDDIDRSMGLAEMPETVEPAECSEYVRGDVERGSKGLPVAGIDASDEKHGISYHEMIVRARDAVDWDPRSGDVMLEKCGEMSYTTKTGQRITVHGTRVDGILGEGYATSMTTGEEFGIGGFTVATAITRVGDYLVQFIGIGVWAATGPMLYEPEFVRLANTANERVATAL